MRYFAVLTIMLWGLCVFGFDRTDRIYDAIEKSDYGLADSLLAEWVMSEADAPELLIAKFNRYINESRISMLLLSDNVSPVGEAIILSDSTDNPVGSLAEHVEWNDSLFNKAASVISHGIVKYPRRLDMRLGYSAALQMRGLWEQLVEELTHMLNYGQRISYNWLWSENDQLSEPIQVMLDATWDYCSSLYNAYENDQAFELCSNVLKLFPDEMRFINLAGAIKYLGEDYEGALGYFRDALRVAPDDEIVMSNIAQISFQTGNYDEALRMCERVLSMSDADPDIMEFVRDIKTNISRMTDFHGR